MVERFVAHSPSKSVRMVCQPAKMNSASARFSSPRSESLDMATLPVNPPLDAQGRPYFLWSEEMNDQRFRRILAGAEGQEPQALYTARLLREARVAEVWAYLTPQDIADRWPKVKQHLGRMTSFWETLLEAWRDAERVSWSS